MDISEQKQEYGAIIGMVSIIFEIKKLIAMICNKRMPIKWHDAEWGIN